MILAAGLTPAWQQIVEFDGFAVGQVNRARSVHWCASGKVLNVGIALQMYAGALSDYEDQYTNKVMNEKARLQQVVTQVLRRPPPAPMRTASVRTTSAYASPLD